jgi:hypothetical protein
MADAMFQFSAVASGYSQITGLLAGFSFAAVGVLLVKPSEEQPGLSRTAEQEISSAAILALLVSFGVLMLSSFAYAGVPGPGAIHLSAMLFFIGSSLFAMGVTTIFTAIAWLFVIYKLAKSVLAFARVLACGAILVAVFNELYAANLLVRVLADTMQFVSTYFETIATVIIVILILIVFIVSVLSARRSNQIASARLFRIMMFVVLLGAIIAGAYIALIAGWRSDAAIDILFPTVVFYVTLIFTVIVAALCVWAQPPNSLWDDVRRALAIAPADD